MNSSVSKVGILLIFTGLLAPVRDALAKNASDSSKTKRVSVFGVGVLDSSKTNLAEANAAQGIFYSEGLIPTLANNDSVRKLIDKATAVFKAIDSTKNFIASLSDKEGFKLPVGIGKVVGGLSYDIGIYAIRLKPSYAEIDAFMQFNIPQNGKTLIFHAAGIKFSKTGGIIGDAKLQLAGDYAINFNGDKGQLVLKGGIGGAGNTFARMDCDGFREMSLDAEVRFSRDLLLPEDRTGSVTTGNVTAAFQSVVSDWNDLLVQLTLPNFQINGLTGFGFSITDAVFDFSDMRNAPNVVFPHGYATESDATLANLWRGVYVRQLSVRLPSHFANRQNTGTMFTATDLLIDHRGVSGTFAGRNIIPLADGDMNGWAFSVDSLAVSLLANQIQSAGFKGNIVVPITDRQTPFGYVATFGADNQYLFDVTAGKNMQFTVFQTSKVEIYKGSTLEVKVADGRFMPRAILSGKMDIAARLSDHGQGVNLADIKFENLQIQSVQPYIKAGNFSFGSEAFQQVMAGFPISINNVGLTSPTVDQVCLNFDLKLNLVGESGGAFAAEAGLSIVGQVNETNRNQSWNYKNIEVRSIDIDIDQGQSFKFKGRLTYYRQDPIYGDGFNGSIKATFLSKVTVNASAIFGNLKGERYWYADALVKFTEGIPFFPGVGFYGFGGGAYYRMKMDQSNSSPIGKTASGTSYVPALNNGLGLKAIVYLGSMPTEKAFTADVTFEIAFFKGGGVHTISMTGNAFIATPNGLSSSLDQLKSTVGNMRINLPKLEQALDSRLGNAISRITNNEISNVEAIQGAIGSGAGEKGGISAHVYICYDFENNTLHGNFDTKIDVASGVLKGGGDAVLHFAPHEWYVYVGTPDQRFTISIGIGPIRATANSYFMVGTTIPGSPPPPPEVSQILGGKDLDYMKDLNAIGSGAGFAFGSALSVKTGELTFLMFYASFNAGAGFDIMVKDYGNTYCEGSNSRIGINGWYANGQAYAYFTGDIGITLSLFMSTKHIKILSIGAAAVLQAKLPNPIWMRGNVGGYFSVLGGLVSGRCDFEVTLGNECKLIKKSDDSALKNISVISQLTPGVGETEVNVFNNPQAVFNLAVDKPFSLANGDTQETYKVNLDNFTLTVDGNLIQATLQWNDSHTVAALNTLDVLPSKKQIKSSAQVSFQKWVNGSWQNVLQNGQPVGEKQEVIFTTGVAPDYIPLSNVEYSYPVIGQLNFYRNESNEGYIKLKKGQSYLFNPNTDWTQTGQFKDLSGAKTSFDFTYNSSNTVVNFNIPGNLKGGEIYSLQLVNVPRNQNGAIDRNVSSVSNHANVAGQNVNAEIKTQQARGSITQLQEKSIFSAYLRSSKYASLSEKVVAQNLATVLCGVRILWGVYYLKGPFEIDEPFEKAELYGTSFTGFKPLVSFEADLSDNKYYNEQAYPLIYDGYPLDGFITIKNRAPEALGIPPVRAVRIIQSPDNFELDQNNLQYQPAPTTQYYFYDLPNYMYYDFRDIQQQVANRYLTKTTVYPRIEEILWGEFPMILKGDYKVSVRYTLPGQQSINSRKQVTLNNPIGK